MENGVIHHTTASNIPSGPLPIGVWVIVSVEVSATEAVIKMNGQVISNVSPHHPLLTQGGVAIPNGNGNVVSYKNYRLAFHAIVV